MYMKFLLLDGYSFHNVCVILSNGLIVEYLKYIA